MEGLIARVALAAALAVFGGAACKSNKSSANFSQGKKSGKQRSPASIDKSRQVDINTQTPANAITKGSFTVWTEPKDPAPGQSYQVFIEVRLPASVTSYQASDLSGAITGTDGYSQLIGEGAGLKLQDEELGDAGETFPDEGGGKGGGGGGGASEGDGQTFSFANGRGRLSTWVPGAEDLVKDTVDVRSRVLNEQQQISIVF